MQRIALICGGKSPEHEISVRSGKNILAALDRNKYEVQLIGIDQGGVWRLLEEDQLGKIVPKVGVELSIAPGNKDGQIIRRDTNKAIPEPAAIFLILHGPNGEDGTIQGLLRLLNLPFIGPDVASSALAMDKDFAKQILKHNGIHVARGMVFQSHEIEKIDYDQVTRKLGPVLFIKPANMGSSVGVNKVMNATEFKAAIEDAFIYDKKILIEEMIIGRELECAVMGNEAPKASTIGEVVVNEAYSYEAKYISQTAAKIQIPARLSEGELAKLQDVARRAYAALGCEVIARVDMFLTPEGDVYVNEINTLPGFTSISMYPKLWEYSGISYSELLDTLLEYAFRRHKSQSSLKMTW